MHHFREQLRLALAREVNQKIAGELRDEGHFGTPERGYRDAAVLIPITGRSQPGLILTVRPSTMRDHAGQVAFPGGKVDDDDADAVAAALREAEEELAIPSKSVDVVGTGELYLTASGFAITPVIGIVEPVIDIKPNPVEVDDWFEMPFDLAIAPRNLTRKTGVWKGRARGYYDMSWQGYRIWGITAGILANLSRQFYDTASL